MTPGESSIGQTAEEIEEQNRRIMNNPAGISTPVTATADDVRDGKEPGAIDAAPPAAPGNESEPYEEWTVSELRDHADQKQIDLGGATLKADIIAAIRASEA